MTARATRLRSLGALALVVVVGLGAGACSGDAEGDNTATDPAASDTSSEPSASPTESATSEPTESEAPKEPQCADFWVDGAKFKGGYDGCYDGDKRIKPNGRYCEFGKPLVTHAGRFWAVPGGVINEVEGELLDDAAYRDALMKCGG